MDDRDIEDTREPQDEEEEFECSLCEELYILGTDHIEYRNKLICIFCAEDIGCELRGLYIRIRKGVRR